MASATFGQRNAIKPASVLRQPQVAAPRGIDADSSRLEAEPRPAHSVSVRTIDPRNARKILIGVLVLMLVAVVLPVSFFSELRRDATLKDTFRPDISARVEHASCSRYFFLVTSCSVQLSWPDGNARRTAESSFLVALKSVGSLRVVPMRSSADAAVVTSNVALDHLSTRTWTLVLVPGICLLLSVLMLMKLLRGRA